MKTTQDISSFISSVLKDWLVYKPMPFVVTFFEGSNKNGTVGYRIVKEGLAYRKDTTTIQVSINKKLLAPKNRKALEKCLYHEIYHLIQWNLFSHEEIKAMRQIQVEKNYVTQYCDNILELEAEVFAINMCGSSNHSYVIAKEQPLYQETLQRILSRNSPEFH